jgi:hypothetical protein
MNCKDAEKMISPFLEDDLDNRDLAEFLNHMDKCPECREELTIQFLVLVGMKRLEDGNTFNLKQELDNMLRDARKKLRVRKYLKAMSLLLELLVAAMTVATVVLAFALY